MRGRSFADALDEALDAGAEPARPRGPAPGLAAPPPDPFLFFAMAPTSRARAAYVRASAPQVGPFALHRPRRPLTPAQQRALDALTALGARLSPEITPRELRHEYRLLAHRLHPDRHQASSEADRARTSRDFAAATDHYKVLLAMVTRH